MASWRTRLDQPDQGVRPDPLIWAFVFSLESSTCTFLTIHCGSVVHGVSSLSLESLKYAFHTVFFNLENTVQDREFQHQKASLTSGRPDQSGVAFSQESLRQDV